MIQTLRTIVEGAVERLSYQVTTVLPGLLAGLIILVGAYLLATAMHWLLQRIFKGMALDRFLIQSGLATMLDRSGRLSATRLVAKTVYWIILLMGALTALSAFDTNLTSQIIERAVFLFPALVTAGLIVLAGAWLGQYLSRSALVWAVNEGIPSPRRLATAVRLMILFVATVVAADQLNFAKNVFFAAFIILVGGGVLAGSLALGLGSREVVRRYFEQKAADSEMPMERSLRDQL
jgi:Mechanosensitive ion channel, conserved TM helix